MKKKCSVIVCTHNPRRAYLQRTLTGLEGQTLPLEQWELLLIDNASDAPLEGRWDLSWHPAARHILEPELGLTSARLRGISEAKGDLLVFVDDDNVLDEDYLENTTLLLDKHPNLGCIGAGIIAPEFEEEPADSLRPYTSMLALRDEHEACWSNQPADFCVPWGAGLVVRSVVAKSHVLRVGSSDTSKILDRRGQDLLSGGDDDFSWTACSLGYGKGVFPELKLLHLIGGRRVSKTYLLNLREATAFSHALLLWKHRGHIPTVPLKPSITRAFRYFCRGSLSGLLSELHGWWHAQRCPIIETEFKDASHRGFLKAASYIASHSGMNDAESSLIKQPGLLE